jgi:FkbM family methyltransferase
MQLDKITLKISATLEKHFYFRPNSDGDKGVIQQIFAARDYETNHWNHEYYLGKYYEKILSSGASPLIIDAGANIGASAVFYSMKYPDAKIFAIEPEKNNGEIFKMNCESSKIELFSGAISDTDGTMFLHDPGMGDWGFRVVEEGAIPVPTICPQTILANHAETCRPFIFKIDIEGGEVALFSKNTEWMDQFALVVLELHDWMLPLQGSSKNFFKTLAQYDFDVIPKGENVFCFNRRLLAE